MKGNRKKRIAHTIALPKALSNKELSEEENKTLSDKPQPDAKKPKMAPGIVRSAPIILHTTSAVSSFAQLSIRIAMMPTVVISVPICFYVLIYTQKAQTFVVCLYSVSKESWTNLNNPNISTEKPTLAHEHFGFSLDCVSFYITVQVL